MIKSFEGNLIVRFSVVSFILVFILSVVFMFVLTKQLDRNIELLKDHGVAEMSGTIILGTVTLPPKTVSLESRVLS